MTLRQVVFHPEAIAEAETAARWYRERSPQAAARFVEEVNLVIERILEAPDRWPRGPHGSRKLKLPCFPFLINYREIHGVIQVLAVAHGKRLPGYWKIRKQT
jgi:plasmid stabilization system protein ParE